jgi:hypothetical protein
MGTSTVHATLQGPPKHAVREHRGASSPGNGDRRLGIEPEMHDVAVGDDIFLAFQPQLAGVAGAGLAA